MPDAFLVWCEHVSVSSSVLSVRRKFFLKGFQGVEEIQMENKSEELVQSLGLICSQIHIGGGEPALKTVNLAPKVRDVMGSLPGFFFRAMGLPLVLSLLSQDLVYVCVNN